MNFSEKRRKTGGDLHVPIHGEEKMALVDWMRSCTECGDIWENRLDHTSIVKRTYPKEGEPDFFVQPAMGMVDGKECPCLIKTYNEHGMLEGDAMIEEGRFESHGNCPVEIHLSFGYDPTVRKKRWRIYQTCGIRCKYVYLNKFEPIKSVPLVSDVPDELLRILGIKN